MKMADLECQGQDRAQAHTDSFCCNRLQHQRPSWKQQNAISRPSQPRGPGFKVVNIRKHPLVSLFRPRLSPGPSVPRFCSHCRCEDEALLDDIESLRLSVPRLSSLFKVHVKLRHVLAFRFFSEQYQQLARRPKTSSCVSSVDLKHNNGKQFGHQIEHISRGSLRTWR